MPIKTEREIIELSIKEAVSVKTTVRELTDAARDHEEWIKIIKYGIEFLKERPVFLLELVVIEAEKRIMSSSDIMQEIGLRVEPEN